MKAKDDPDAPLYFVRTMSECEALFTPDELEIIVKEDQVEAVLESISTAAKTGRIGDGKIFVTDVGEVVRIRTGETGEAAL